MTYGFHVERGDRYWAGWGGDEAQPDCWYVRLPHSCDAWPIAPNENYLPPLPHAKAVEQLQQFIAEAEEALNYLLQHKETP